MQALDAFGVDWKLLVIQIFNFGLVLLLLRYYLYKPVIKMLDARAEKIKKGLDDANMATKEREELAAKKDEILISARAEGNTIVEGIRKEATEKERELARLADEKRAALMSEARAKAEAEREHLLRESEKEIARMAVLAAEKILKESPATSH